jgi:hypothetical protein
MLTCNAGVIRLHSLNFIEAKSDEHAGRRIDDLSKTFNALTLFTSVFLAR